MRSSLYSTQQTGRGNQDVHGTNASQAHFEDEVIKENEAILNALGGTVSRLKMTAASLREEAGEHNHLLDTLSNAFSGATSGVSQSLQRIDSVMERYGWRHIILIAVFFFFTVYGTFRVFLF